MALANLVTLKLAGIDKSRKSPPGGEIVKDPVTGEPTGVLKDEALSLVYGIIPPSSDQELDESLQRAIKEAFVNGVIQVHDVSSYGGWQDLQTYQRAYKIFNTVPATDNLLGFLLLL